MKPLKDIHTTLRTWRDLANRYYFGLVHNILLQNLFVYQKFNI